MSGAPRYEENPSPHFLAVLRAVVPGFEPTADGWFAVERELKRRLQIRNRPGYSTLRTGFLHDWAEADVLRVLDPTISPFQRGETAAVGNSQERPCFPARPLDPCCLLPANLSSADKAEVISLVRQVQTDFDPETDPRGWDSVAVLVRGVGYGEEECRRMDYPQLSAIFRTSAAQMRLQKTGSLVCGIATATSTIIRLNESAMPSPPPADGSRVLRLGAGGHSTRAIDVDGPLGKIETKMRKELVEELGSESAAQAALVERLYSLSAEDLEPMLRRVGCKADPRTVRRRSDRYKSWEQYRKPPPPPPSEAADLGPAGRAGAEEGEVPSPSRAATTADDLNSGGLSIRSGGRGAAKPRQTAAERAADREAEQFARDAGIELPPAE
jgi:hypothetical protein